MFKLMDKKIITNLRSKFLLIWTCVVTCAYNKPSNMHTQLSARARGQAIHLSQYFVCATNEGSGEIHTVKPV